MVEMLNAKRKKNTWCWYDENALLNTLTVNSRDMWTLTIQAACGVTAVQASFSGTWGEHTLRQTLDKWGVKGVSGKGAPRITKGRYDFEDGTMEPRSPEHQVAPKKKRA